MKYNYPLYSCLSNPFYYIYKSQEDMPKKIMVIEDNEDILDLIKFILENDGYEIVSGEDSQLLGEILIHQPDLVLMDNRLTDGLGSEFCQQLKNDPSTQHFPVVLISANTELEVLAAGSRADGFLAKPFDIKDLVAIVRRYS
jgi:CheY-like chemotaxis protein